MDFRLTAEQELLRRSVREFAETEMRPHVREWDQAQQFPAELVPQLAALGLMGIQFPEEYGGAGMSAIDYCICIEELARVDPAVALSVAAHNGLCAAHIALVGHRASRSSGISSPLARGEKIGAWGLTESTSGSDAAGMRTTARETDGGWVLNGSKTFTTHGRVGDVIVVMAVTSARAARSKGISAFIVEKGTPGFSPGKKEDKLGMRASDTSEVRLRELPRSGRSPAREGRARLHRHDAGARCGPHRHCGARRRPRAGGVRGGAALRARAAGVRQDDRQLSGDSVEARRQRHADRGGAAADLPRGVPEGPRRADDARVGDGQAVCERDRREGGRRLRADLTADTAS